MNIFQWPRTWIYIYIYFARTKDANLWENFSRTKDLNLYVYFSRTQRGFSIKFLWIFFKGRAFLGIVIKDQGRASIEIFIKDPTWIF